MRRECRKRFPRHRLQRKTLVSDPGMHHGTCVTHVLWCMPGSLTHSNRASVPGISGACASRNFAYRVSGPCLWINCEGYECDSLLLHHSQINSNQVCCFTNKMINTTKIRQIQWRFKHKIYSMSKKIQYCKGGGKPGWTYLQIGWNIHGTWTK